MRVNKVGAAFVPLQVPLKPGAEVTEPPGEIDPLYERLVIVTALPVWVKVPLQSWVIVCPLGNENCKLQLLIVVVPVLVMVILAPNPPCHWFVMV